jgi:cytochrome c-type biogenesis protein CcsB
MATPALGAMSLTLGFDALLAASLVHFVGAWTASPRWHRVGAALACAAWLALGTGIVERGISAGRWPLANQFEFAIVLGWAMVGLELAMAWRQRSAAVGLVTVPVTAAVVGWALLATSPAQRAILAAPPVLASIWLVIHVLAAAAGYAAIAIAAAAAITVLVPAAAPGRASLPSKRQAEVAMDRGIALAFPSLSLALVSGAVWAQNAWGHYWSWEPKEIWALVTWLVLLVFLHGRCLRGWRERRCAWVALIGLGCVLVTFLGTGWLTRATGGSSMHVF